MSVTLQKFTVINEDAIVEHFEAKSKADIYRHLVTRTNEFNQTKLGFFFELVFRSGLNSFIDWYQSRCEIISLTDSIKTELEQICRQGGVESPPSDELIKYIFDFMYTPGDGDQWGSNDDPVYYVIKEYTEPTFIRV